MSDRDVTFRLKLADDPSSRKAAESTKKSVKEVAQEVDGLKSKSTQATLAMGEGFRTAAEGGLKLARGIGFLAASGEKDLAKLAKSLAKVQAAFDIGSGVLDMIKGVVQWYGKWADAAKATAAANELVAASNLKVAATGQAAAAGGMGGAGGRGLGGIGLGHVLGAGIGGYAGYRLAESQGMGFGGQLALGAGGSILGSAVYEGAKRAGPWALRGLGAAGRGIASVAAPASGAILAGLAAGEITSRGLNRNLTGENKGTLQIGYEAYKLSREQSSRGDALNREIAIRGSSENARKYMSDLDEDEKKKFLQEREQHIQGFLSRRSREREFSYNVSGQRFDSELFQLGIGKTTRAAAQSRQTRLMERLAGQKSVTQGLQSDLSLGNLSEKERLDTQNAIKESLSEEIRLTQRLSDQQKVVTADAERQLQLKKQGLQIAKSELRASELSFGNASRREQVRVGRALKTLETQGEGSLSRGQNELLDKYGVATERRNNYKIEKARQAEQEISQQFGLKNGIFGEQREDVKKKTEEVVKARQTLGVETKTLVKDMSEIADAMVSMHGIMKRVQEKIESDEQLRNSSG